MAELSECLIRMAEMKAKKASKTVGSDDYFSLGKLYEKVTEACTRGEIERNSIRLETKEMVYALDSRLSKLESLPKMDTFQQKICPNTNAITLLTKWIEKHDEWHQKTEEERVERAKEQRKMMWSAISSAALAVLMFALNIIFVI